MSSEWETLREVPRLQEKIAWRMQAMRTPFHSSEGSPGGVGLEGRYESMDCTKVHCTE